jgi:cell division control protein 6
LTDDLIWDERALMPDYVPMETPGRQEELQRIHHTFSAIFIDPTLAPVAMVVGPVGCGKTMTVKKASQTLCEEARLSGVYMASTYVNCRIDRSPASILNRVTHSLSLQFPRRGFEIQETLDFIHQNLVSSRSKLLLILDEVDSLSHPGDENLLYALLRMGEVWGSSPVALLLAAKDVSFIWGLDESVRSSLRRQTIRLEPYTAQQLVKILEARAKEALAKDALNPDACELIAEMAGQYGDARYAIELLYRSAVVARERGAVRIYAPDVLEARNSLPPQVGLQELEYLTLHERIILIATAKLLQSSSKAFVSTGELEAEYRSICAASKVKPHGHTTVWITINEMKSKGLLLTSQSGRGRRGRTTMVGLNVPPREVMRRAALLAKPGT